MRNTATSRRLSPEFIRHYFDLQLITLDSQHQIGCCFLFKKIGELASFF
jgi:hypothetical protein